MKIYNKYTNELIVEVDDLSDADLSGADLSEADLSEANLSGADLSGADLSEANLSGADLSGADLSGANLRDANLTDADLSGANLRGASLCGADLRNADLHEASGCVVLPVGDPRGYRAAAVWHGTHWRIFAGCRAFTVAEARKHWGDYYRGDRKTGDKYLLALDWLMRTHPVDPSITCSIQRRHLIQIQEAA